MLLLLIKIALGFSAIYGFGMWLFMAVRSFFAQGRYVIDEAYRAQVERFTFHLGICAIVAAGFLGIILVNGG